MGITQPAVRHALKRLRTLNGDPLFVRRLRGLEPTALSREPKTTKINLETGPFNYELATILPDLISNLRASPDDG